MSSHDPFAPLAGNAAGAPRETTQEAVSNQAPGSSDPEVPKGTRAEVLDWVGNDKERAQLALAAENETGEPRKTLVAELNELLKS